MVEKKQNHLENLKEWIVTLITILSFIAAAIWYFASIEKEVAVIEEHQKVIDSQLVQLGSRIEQIYNILLDDRKG